MNNRKEFEELMARYESITIEEIKNVCNEHSVKQKEILTGFGDSRTCTLCLNAKSCLHNCMWYVIAGIACHRGNNRYTYDQILEAVSSNEILIAYRNRAKYMKDCLNKYDKENKE